MYVCLSVCICESMCVFICGLCMPLCVNVRVSVCMCICECLYVFICGLCLPVCASVCLCVQVYVCVCIIYQTIYYNLCVRAYKVMLGGILTQATMYRTIYVIRFAKARHNSAFLKIQFVLPICSRH